MDDLAACTCRSIRQRWPFHKSMALVILLRMVTLLLLHLDARPPQSGVKEGWRQAWQLMVRELAPQVGVPPPAQFSMHVCS